MHIILKYFNELIPHHSIKCENLRQEQQAAFEATGKPNFLIYLFICVNSHQNFFFIAHLQMTT